MTYTQAKEAKSLKIDAFKSDSIAARLLSMGVLPGAVVEYVRKAPFAGAYYIKINGQCFALRKEEFESITFSA